MSWKDYKKQMEEVWKKQEEEKRKAKTEKKQNSSNKTTNNTSIQRESNLNTNKNTLISNTNTLQDIINTNKNPLVKTNSNPLSKIIEEKNANSPLQKAIKEQQSKPKTTQSEPSTWDKIMQNFGLGGKGGVWGLAQTGYRDIRDIDNAYTEASSLMRHNVLSTFFGEQGENFARGIDERLYKWNDDRNKFYNYALDVLNKDKQEDNQIIQQNIEAVKQSGDKVGAKFVEISPSIGQNAIGMLGTAVNPALGFTYYKMSSEASYYDDALNRGMTEDQAKAYSKIMSYVEAGTETLSASNVIKGGKVLKATVTGTKTAGVKVGLKAGFNVLKEGAKEEVTSSFKNALKSYGIGIAEEAFQEGITEPLQELTAMATAGKDKADWSNMPQRIFNSAFDGALSSLVLAGANMGISSCQGVVTNLKEGKPVSEEQFKTSLQDASKELDAGKILTDTFTQEVDKIKTELQTQEPQQNKDNQVINQEQKTSQNETSQAPDATEALRQEARSKLESIKQNYDENSYNQMQEFIETAPNEKALNQVINDLNKESERTPIKTENKSFEDVAFEAMNNYEDTTPQSPMQDRNIDTIGKETNKNAYQYDNPKVKPYFQEMAQQMGEDLAYISSSDNRSTQKGGGTKLSTTTKAMEILHNEQGYSYDQIAKGLQNIIDDKGSENNAISKKIELVIDEQLREGYTNALGKNIAPNQEYINTIQGNKDVQLPMKQKQEIILPTKSGIANNQEMLYNSTNESESDVNGQIQSRGMEQLSNERNDTNIQQNEEYKEGRKYTKQEYGEWESSIKPTEENNITTEQKTIKDNIKRQYNKDIVFFDGENNYNAGASLSDKNKIYVNSKQVDSFGINKVIYHEIMESNIFHNKEISNDIIQPAIEKIINDPEFENQKNIFWSGQKGNIPSDYAIAKDILCDRFSVLKTNEDLDYQNVLSNETNMTIDYALENFNKKINEQNVKGNTTNSNNMQNNKENIQQFSKSEQQNQGNFEYKPSDNAKIDTFRQDASRYWDNSEKTNKLVNTIEKVINDKGYNIRLDDTLGDNVNGRIVTNNQTGEIEITLNPNSSRTGEFIIGHELTHAIQTQEMLDLIEARMKKDGNLRNAVEDLKKLYNTDEINAEVLADISGQLFGNQEFINNLSIEKPNVFKRIYDKIISLANKITGNSNEALFIKDLKNKWEKAYRENTNKINEAQYSKANLTTDNQGNELNPNMQKWAKNSKARVDSNGNISENGKLATVYHTTTDNVSQFNEFNPVGTPYYRFGDQVVNYFTDSKDMSGSYANNRYEMADTKRLNNLEEARQWIKQQNSSLSDYTIEENIDKKGNTFYALNDNDRPIIGLYFENENDLLRNLKQRFNEYREQFGRNESKLQYEGYVNITNPYIIDAEGKNWNTIPFKLSTQGNELIEILTKIEDNNVLTDIKGTLKKIENIGLDSANYYWQMTNKMDNDASTLSDAVARTGSLESAKQQLQDLGWELKDIEKASKKKLGGRSIVDIGLEYYNNKYDKLLSKAVKDIKTKYKFLDNVLDTQLDALLDMNFDKKNIKKRYSENNTTNDIVNQVIEMNKNGANYDGVIIKNVVDYGGDAETREPANLYVTFASNQFKAIDNPNPTSDADIRYSKQNQSWQEYLEKNYKSEGTTTDLRDIRLPMKEKQEVKAPMKQQEQTSAKNAQVQNNNTKVKFDNEVMKTNSEIKGNSETNEKVAKILSEPTKNVKPEQRTWAILKANFIDKGSVFEKISQKTKNRDLQGKYDYTLTAGARGQYAIGNDRYTYSNGKKTLQSKSLTSIIDEVGENTQAFNEYMYHQLNVDRMTLDERFGTENKPVFGESVTADMSRAEIAKIEEQHPEFKKYAEDVYNYLDTNKQELVDRGVISQETSDMFKERYPHYVPIQRATRHGNSIDVALDTKRTGINSPIKKAKGGNQDINPLFQTMASQTLQTYRASARNNFGLELKNTLQQMDQLNENRAIADIDDIVDTMTNEEQNNELLQPGKKGENPTFTVFEDGKKITYDISQDMYDALKPKSELLNKWDNTKLAKAGRKISNFRRGVLTEYNPIFSITNAIKDAQDVLINSQHSGKTYAKFPEAYAQIMKKGYWYNEYIQNGGEQNSYFTEGDFENIKKTKLDKAKNVLKFPLEKISQVNNVIEMAPRLAEYIVSRENGASVETAMLDAARVTTNFKAGGDITKFANRNGVTFLNASVQGFQQQVRNIQEANVKGLKGWTTLAAKYAIAGLPALLLNNLFWDDDDDYEQLQDYVKDNYYVIAKLPNGNFLRIPKGRMTATIQKVVSNVNDFVKDGKINSDDVASTIWNDLKEDIKFGADNLAPNNPIENNILSPIFQVAQNKTWYGEDLVPKRLQDVPAAEQADETTDKFSKWLGDKLNVSPIKINYLLDQYSGGIGDVLLPLGTPQAENNVIEDKFTTDPVMKSQYPSDFFSKVDELNVKHNSIKATDEDILKYKYISSVQQEVSGLYKQKREIQASDKSDETKKQELKEVQKQINKLAKESLENVDKVSISGESATIGDKQYYKNKGSWTKLTDKEKEKLNGTSTSVYSDYKNATNDLSDKEKIQTLRDSNYSKTDKSNLYEKTISTDKYYPTLKQSGIDIDEYMDYKLAQSNGDFIADKKNGKTVMGSGKKKVLNYLNKNITGYGNRLLIAGKQYSLTAAQRKDLVDYINKTFATQAERTKVYEQLKLNFVVNGNRVTYK